MLKEFKAFIAKGNVIDLAVAVIIGGAFGAIVKSLVADIIMPVIGAILGGTNFADLVITIGDATITYGNFIQAVVNFLIIAWVIFMFVRSTKKDEPAPPPPGPSTEEKLLTEIRDLLAKK